MASAAELKQQGKVAFQNGDYKGAEGLYTRALQKGSANLNLILYTNRAFTRIRLQSWDPCINDCHEAIQLDVNCMKAYYYMAQAQLALNHPNEALNSAKTAYDLCLMTCDASTSLVSTLVLRAKKELWEVRERERLRERSELLEELEESILIKSAKDIRAIREKVEKHGHNWVHASEEASEIEASTRRKVEDLKSVFAIADPQNLQRREVPDYIIDNISFAIMHDPVITKNGRSYERSTILEHLRRSNSDPLTREPLTREDLRPNLALKEVCAEFLVENGWAVDW